jgi:hypothetical protein
MASVVAMLSALWLSQSSGKGRGSGSERLVVKRRSHIASRIVCDIDMYSASVEDRATVFCLAADQDTNEPYRKNA